jgi:hypothetical protein
MAKGGVRLHRIRVYFCSSNELFDRSFKVAGFPMRHSDDEMGFFIIVNYGKCLFGCRDRIVDLGANLFPARMNSSDQVVGQLVTEWDAAELRSHQLTDHKRPLRCAEIIKWCEVPLGKHP